MLNGLKKNFRRYRSGAATKASEFLTANELSSQLENPYQKRQPSKTAELTKQIQMRPPETPHWKPKDPN